MKHPSPTPIGLLAWRTVAYYLVVGLVFVVLKVGHRLAEPHQLRFLLKPVSALVDAASGTQSVYVYNQGYLNPAYHIIIDKSCSGFNFWILCFCLLAILITRFVQGVRYRLAWLPVLLVLGYLCTLWVNASRIMFAVVASRLAQGWAGQYPWLHQAEGTFVYLFCLVLIYMGMQYLLTKLYGQHAKPT